MAQFGTQMRSFAGTKSVTALPPPKVPHNGVADVKPRLTKEQHDILEAHFIAQHKPSTSTKKGFAETLGVPVDKINNWFQNRRAKVKQDMKKQLNQLHMGMGMGVGLYGPPQMPSVTSQFAPHGSAPQPSMHSDFYTPSADISPTALPVQSIEGPSVLDLGSQMPLQPYDIHSLRSIPEADRATPYNPNAVYHSFMAATEGASSYMQGHAASLPPQIPNFTYDVSSLSNNYPGELAFSVSNGLPNESAPSNEPFTGFPDFATIDFPSLASANTSSSAEGQNSLGSLSSEPSPFSGTQSTATTQSSAGVNTSSVTSIASMYSGWTEEQKPIPDMHAPHETEDQFPYNMPQAAASDQAFMPWPTNSLYQHSNASAHAILSSPAQSEDQKLEPPPAFTDDIYSRRNSSTTNLASNIEAIHIQGGHTPDGFKQPDQPSSIAARRQKRPTALNPSTLRSASYSSSIPSPSGNNDHTLRRIRSSGIPNAAGRVQKPSSGSAQRSPMCVTFTEAASSPKFARTFSESSTATAGQGGSLAPPTPLTPNEMGRFPYWQGNTVIKNEHSSPESLNVNWSVEPQSAGLYSSGNSPPSTPLDLSQLNQARLANENIYRDTPPQSAPATQQGFPNTTFMQPPQMRAGFHSTTDLTISEPKPSHYRRPSLPDAGHGSQGEFVRFPGNLSGTPFDERYGDLSLQGITHNVPFAPPVSYMPELMFQQYAPPQGADAPPFHRRSTEPQQKSYIFANQGPGDFRSN
ncbi:hypothetical protein K491DRAFT_372109 [Lophiostoma macrostomum CBS 122681]|uniref:Homeobox domain-containing protein n=1 Tax=Lophiostoma macrostomum CBS 122681 TaxID=1314788 RepID=A0A6A6TC88_9PLEO|nr:hypothetical protein K491DRAFT_372109 [Lophiostoma macrostomum CBS 122681]